MITVVTSQGNQRLVKEFLNDGSKLQEEVAKSFNLEVKDPQTPDQLKDILSSLESNQAIIAGTHIIPGKTTTSARKAENFKFISPWLPFDRDYITPKEYITSSGQPKPYIQVLSDIDPQLANVSYLIKSSASNIIRHSLDCPNYGRSLNTKGKSLFECSSECQLVNPHREKLWVQFHPLNTTTDIIQYSKDLFIKAIARGYLLSFLSKSERAYPTLLHRTVFDATCFQTQALSFEGVPITQPPYTHNTYYKTHNGLKQYVDTRLLIVTDLERKQAAEAMASQQLVHKAVIIEKALKLKADHPEQDWVSIDRGVLTEGTVLYSTEHGRETTIRVSDITEAIITNNQERLTHYATLPFKDPLDPDYGDNKAKMYVNDDHSVYLHSFAHGAHYFKILPNVIHLPRALQSRGYIIDYNAKNSKKPHAELARTFRAIKELAPLFYSEDEFDVDRAAEDLKQVGSKPAIRALLAATVQTAQEIDKANRKDNHPLSQYSFLAEGQGKVIKYDNEEGLSHFTSSGAQAWLANKEEGVSGVDLYNEWLTDARRNDVSGFGLYPPETKGKLNMWLGFNTQPLDNSSRDDIAPFTEFIDVLTNGDDKGSEWLLDWLADLVQQPLRDSDIRTAVVLESYTMGTGKSTFAEFVQSFFASTNTLQVAKMSRIIGQFNIRLMPIVFVVLNEVVNDTVLTHNGIVNVIKDMLGNPFMEVEAKGIDSKVVPNRLHVLVTTNAPFRYIENNDRRITVFKVAVTKAEDRAYFTTLRDWWYKENGRELTFTYLLKRAYNMRDVTTSYKGRDTVKAAIDSLYNFDAWFLFFIRSLTVSDITLTSSELHNSYDAWIASEEPSFKTSPYYLSQFKLTKQLKEKYGVFDGLRNVNNTYQINKERIAKQFASIVLNAPDADVLSDSLTATDIDDQQVQSEPIDL